MKKTNVPYGEWPEWIKVVTALYVKRVIPKEPKTLRKLSCFNLIIGISVLIMGLSSSNSDLLPSMDFLLIFLGVLNIILGGLNFLYGYKMYQWIVENSSWEERFSNKSSGKHQIQYVLMYAVLALISAAIACLFCC